MYKLDRQNGMISPKTRDILILLICALIILNAVQFFNYQTTMSRSAVLRETLISRARQDIDAANTVAPQLSNMGGSNTLRWLSQTRQYLYGVTQLNELAGALFGGGQSLVPQKAVDDAMTAINTCEAMIQEGQTISGPLLDLHSRLGELQEAINSLN